MTPQAAIAALDRQMAAHGSSVTLKRGIPTSPSAQVVLKAHYRDFRLDELVGALKQDDTKVVLSPSSLGGFGLPQRGDWIVLDERTRSVENADVARIQGVPVRVELVVRG